LQRGGRGGPHPRPARDAAALPGHRPRAARLPAPGPRLPPDGRAWQGGEGAAGMRTYTGADGPVWAVARLGGRNQLAALVGRAVVVWDEGSSDPVQTLPMPEHSRTHARLACCPSGEWLTASQGIVVFVWHWSGK